MKKYTLLVITILTALIFLNSCESAFITLNVMVPAGITVPLDIQKIAIINRSLLLKENIITNEGVIVDQDSSDVCISGAINQLLNLPRYKEVKGVPGLDLRESGSFGFSEPLPWSTVDSICTLANVDALATLDLFDLEISYNEGTETRSTGDNEYALDYKVWWKEMNINTRAGWRLYDVVNKTIIDQYLYTDKITYSSEGYTEKYAISTLPKLSTAIPDAAYYAGEEFAFRISPSWTSFSRKYYISGVYEFRKAKRFVKENNWDKAIEIWRKYASDPNPKIAGRACYNIALGAEVKGKLNFAIDWAEKSYTVYGNEFAKEYLSEIKMRAEKEELLDKQLQN